MKVILSRKGFDSENGGYPSPILPDGKMISLPIPDQEDQIKYSSLKFGKETIYDLMKGLMDEIKIYNKWEKLSKNTTCHLDPDIYREFRERPKNWKPLFGQIGGAQSHLENQKIKEDDVFLFFGWFRRTKMRKGKLVFDTEDYGKHVIFGYLQIGEILRVKEDTELPNWMEYHPHASKQRRKGKNNTIYIAKERLSWNNDLPGAGTFDYAKSLVLTKEGEYRRSVWELPRFFKYVNISYHSPASWRNDGSFQSAGRGQEFVIQDDKKVEKWIRNLIEENYKKQ